MNGQEAEQTGAVLPVVAEPEARARAVAALADPAGDWLCASCLNRVANERDRFRYDGKEEFAFSNPAGVGFVILTFSQTLGCLQEGKPTSQHTWFPGHAWSYCLCERCGEHLGWCYAGPQDFVGLIKDRIVRALSIRN